MEIISHDRNGEMKHDSKVQDGKVWRENTKANIRVMASSIPDWHLGDAWSVLAILGSVSRLVTQILERLSAKNRYVMPCLRKVCKWLNGLSVSLGRAVMTYPFPFSFYHRTSRLPGVARKFIYPNLLSDRKRNELYL
jgi:hypothetical protein